MNREIWRMFRFLVAGGVNTAFGYASYAAFILAGAPLWLAVSGSTVLAMLFNFFTYGRFVFGSNAIALLPRFVLFNAAMGVCNFVALRALEARGFGPLLAQALLVPFLAAGGYFGMRAFVFRSAAAQRLDSART